MIIDSDPNSGEKAFFMLKSAYRIVILEITILYPFPLWIRNYELC